MTCKLETVEARPDKSIRADQGFHHVIEQELQDAGNHLLSVALPPKQKL